MDNAGNRREKAGGRKKGAPKTGGRQRGTPNKVTQVRQKLLRTVQEQFKRDGYDPIKEMIKLAKKPILEEQDPVKFNMHRDLAKKYFPDVAAVKLSGDPDAPLTIQVVRESYNDYVQALESVNGHGTTNTPTV